MASLPGDEVHSPVGSPRREELQGKPLVPRLMPPPHLLPEAVMPLSVQAGGGAPGTVLGALTAAAATIQLGTSCSIADNNNPIAGTASLVDHGE